MEDSMAAAQTFRSLIGLSTLALLVGAVGCATTSQSAASQPAESQPAASAAKTSPALTDAQIAAIVVTANQIDVDNGALAMEKSTNEEVRKFAHRMMEDHTAVNKAASELVTRLGVTPEETDTSRGLAKSATETRDGMRSLDGAAFDKAYVDNEVAYHTAVIDVLDKILIPSAQNAELKSTLESVRPAFIAHLEHARSIQASLGGAASSHDGH